ncbi:MAG TPA: hypothetical protein PKH77_19835 [Anaerolineae bacterium]|nr:hypothetical protein [Anaerolineae bacterium]
MNHNTRALLTGLFQANPRIELNRLITQVQEAWAAQRDAYVERIAWDLHARIPHSLLLRRAPKLIDLANRHGYPTPDTDTETPEAESDLILWTAWAIAACRWQAAMDAGRYPPLDYTAEEVRCWWQIMRQPQLSLFTP